MKTKRRQGRHLKGKKMKNHITIDAMAKINLVLDVTGKRPDGYHELRMVMQTVGLFDTLEFTRSEGVSIKTVSAKREKEDYSEEEFINRIGSPEKNLAYRAVCQLKEIYGCADGLDIRLNKKIPIAAGLAGGSTDAAAAFEAANVLFGLGLSKEQLMEHAVGLGADIPYCIQKGTALAEGIGEKLTPLPKLPECSFLLVKPDIEVSTKWVYQNLKINEIEHHPDVEGMLMAIREGNLKNIASHMENVLEQVTEKEYPVISTIKYEMRRNGALNALMSGSGPTVFGLYSNMESALRAKAYFENAYPAYDVFAVKPGYL